LAEGSTRLVSSSPAPMEHMMQMNVAHGTNIHTD
jgi:hypothetical protein